MKKILSTIFLALMGLVQLQAQETDLKSAPDLPTFKVTLEVENGSGGKIMDGKQVLTAGKYDVNTKKSIVLVAEKGKMLATFAVGTDTKIPNVIWGSGDYPTQNTYNYELLLSGQTKLSTTWKDKPSIALTVIGQEQTVNSEKAAIVSVTTDIKDLVITPAYFMDKECTKAASEEARKKTGTYYVKLETPETATYRGLDTVVVMKITDKLPLQTKTPPSSESIMLQGQQLSLAAIKNPGVYEFGTEKQIPGTWKWRNPATELKAGENSYVAVYTPADIQTYMSLEAEIKVSAKNVTTVTTKQTAGGMVVIENATADNKYVGLVEDVATISAKAIPNAGYKFVGWVNPKDATNVGSESMVTKLGIQATEGLVISAEFAKATRQVNVTISPENSGTVTLNGKNSSGYEAELGSTVNIAAIPNSAYVVESVVYRLKEPQEVTASSFIVGGEAGDNYTVIVKFKIKNSDPVVNVAKVENGSIQLKLDENVIAPNSSVTLNSQVTVLVLPNKGYELKSLTQDETAIVNGSVVTVAKDTEIAASFQPKKYPLTVASLTGVEFSEKSKEVLFGEKLTLSAKETNKDQYRLLSLIVNNKVVENGTEIAIDGPTQVTAQVRKLIPVSLLNLKESIDYDGYEKAFVARTAEGLTGFVYKYKDDKNISDIPKDAGTYSVEISRPADNVYAAFNGAATLEIKQALPVVVNIPFLSDFGNENKLKVEGGTWHKGILKSSDNNIYFVPADVNQKPVNVVTVANDKVKVVNVTITNNSSLGTVVLKNGDLPVGSLSTYAGQTLTIEATPVAGYTVDWGKITLSTGALNEGHIFTLTENVIVTVDGEAFKSKKNASAESKTIASSYNGKIQVVTLNQLSLTPADSKWRISYKQEGVLVSPIAVGTYKVFASRDEDDTYQAAEIEAGTFTIEQTEIKKSAVTVPTATAIRKGDLLSLSNLEGGQVKVGEDLVLGTFAWKSKDGSVDKAEAKAIEFTPIDGISYKMADGTVLTSFVSLLDVPVYTLTLTAVNTGSATITDATGASLVNGAKVAEGTQITIREKTADAIVDVIVGGKKLTRTEGDGLGTYNYVVGKADFTITIVYYSAPEPEEPSDPSDPDYIDVTGVSLDVSSHTLAVGESFIMLVTVSPSNASVKTVAWTSSDEAVATVDAYGIVTALKEGTCTITVSTDDGNKTASCELTVTSTGTVGVDEIFNTHKVYSTESSIVVAPAYPVELKITAVIGVSVYNERISGSVRIPVSPGIYFIQIVDNGKRAVIKMNVR